MRRTVIENFYVRGGLDEDLGMRCESNGTGERKKQNESRAVARDPDDTCQNFRVNIS